MSTIAIQKKKIIIIFPWQPAPLCAATRRSRSSVTQTATTICSSLLIWLLVPSSASSPLLCHCNVQNVVYNHASPWALALSLLWLCSQAGSTAHPVGIGAQQLLAAFVLSCLWKRSTVEPLLSFRQNLVSSRLALSCLFSHLSTPLSLSLTDLTSSCLCLLPATPFFPPSLRLSACFAYPAVTLFRFVYCLRVFDFVFASFWHSQPVLEVFFLVLFALAGRLKCFRVL